MSKEGSKSPPRIDFAVSKIVTITAPRCEMSDDFIERVIDQAEILPKANCDYVRFQIRAQANSYLNNISIEQYYGPPSKGKKALRSLDRPFRVMLERIESLSVEQTFQLDALMCREMKSTKSTGELMETCRRIKVLRDVASVMTASDLKSGNRELHVLEFVVGALMLLFEQTSGQRAKVVMNKDGEYAPELLSPQAKAIGLLLTHIDPSLEPSTIVGKIDKIRREYSGKMRQEFALALWLPTQQVRPTPAEEA